MKILVTGGAGFIGSHLVDKLIELGHEVTVMDDLSTGKKENINPKANFIHCDIATLTDLTLDVDYIFHLAAIPRMPYSILHPDITHRVNVDGTFNVLMAAKQNKVKKVIFASSSSVYGGNEMPMKETQRPDPKTPYALHKLIGEQYCKLFTDVYKVPTVALRFFNVYGSRADPDSEYSLVIARFLKRKTQGKQLVIFGDGEQTRDFTHVSDIVDGCIKAMDNGTGVINLCNGEGVSINKVADLIGGRKKCLPPREGDVLHTLGDNTKAQKMGWKPKVSIEEGIERA